MDFDEIVAPLKGLGKKQTTGHGLRVGNIKVTARLNGKHLTIYVDTDAKPVTIKSEYPDGRKVEHQGIVSIGGSTYIALEVEET